jgi:tRNA pseudouridine32 synthase/23S rRNA pseudouridine746 synthase
MPRQRPAAPLPPKNGVAPSFLWLPEGSWPDLLAFLAQRFPAVPREDWRARLLRGEVLERDGTVLRPDSPAKRGMCIYYYRDVGAETIIPFEARILYQDEHLLVADKPHFLPVTPSGRFVQETLLVRLRQQTGLMDLVPVHRLDRETAGVVLFSVQPATRNAYQGLFRERAIEKEYEAVAPLAAHLPAVYRSRIVPGEPFFCMREEAGEPNAETHLHLLAQDGAHGLYRLRPVTGRQHQLRVHLSALGIPIVNDAFYPVALPCKGDDWSAPLQLLARSVAFTDPVTGERRAFRSALRLALDMA